MQAFYDGRAAFCPLSSTALAEAQSYLGADVVDFIPFPSVDPAASRFAGRPLMDSQGFSIPVRADQPVLAARFLAFIHQRQWAERLWTLGRQLPASRIVEPGAIDDPRQREVYRAWVDGEHAPFVTNLLPRPVRQRLIPVTLRGVLNGELQPDEIPELARRVRALAARVARRGGRLRRLGRGLHRSRSAVECVLIGHIDFRAAGWLTRWNRDQYRFLRAHPPPRAAAAGPQ